MRKLSKYAKNHRNGVIDRVLLHIKDSHDSPTPKAVYYWFKEHVHVPCLHEEDCDDLGIIRLASVVCIERILWNCITERHSIAKTVEILSITKLEAK